MELDIISNNMLYIFTIDNDVIDETDLALFIHELSGYIKKRYDNIGT